MSIFERLQNGETVSFNDPQCHEIFEIAFPQHETIGRA